MDFCLLSLLGGVSASVRRLFRDDEVEFGALSLRTGNLGNLVLETVGIGTVCDFLMPIGEYDTCAMDGDADDHDIGVVVAVDALQGLGDPVNIVEGLLTVLTEPLVA